MKPKLSNRENLKYPRASPPELSGETAMSGSMPDPESDDDLLEDAHQVGEQLKEDEEHPQEIDIARDVDAAEKYQQTH